MEKSKEEIVREEMRAAADMMLKTCQWAVTTLIALQTAIFFLRTGTLDRMIKGGQIPKGGHLPWNMYLMGTFVLVVVAGIFSGMTILTSKYYRHYRQLLIENNESGLPVAPLTNFARVLVVSLYFTFPALDILIRVYIQVGLR